MPRKSVKPPGKKTTQRTCLACGKPLQARVKVCGCGYRVAPKAKKPGKGQLNRHQAPLIIDTTAGVKVSVKAALEAYRKAQQARTN